MESTETTTLDVATNAPAGGKQAEDKMLPQAEVDRIIADRLARQKAQFADYDQLKEGAAKWAELQAAQKSEAEKTQELLTKLQHERDEALTLANERLIRAAFIAAASKSGVQYPEDVFALADRTAVLVDAKGNVAGVDEAVTAVVQAGRVPLLTGAAPKTPAAKLDGGAGAATRSTEKTTVATDDEVAIATRLGIPLENYVARRKERDAALRT
jgi:hypothetical protein